jgi:putative restriction endonuclease
MSSWVIAVDGRYSEHWQIAKHEGLWDMVDPRAIRSGDIVYFWMTGKKEFVGRAVVSGDARQLTHEDELPWSLHDNRTYSTRIHFRDITEMRDDSPPWSEVAKRTGWQGRPDWAQSKPLRDSAAERWLSSLFTAPQASDEAEDAFREADDAAEFLGKMTADRRKRVLAEITVRRGQRKFRNALKSAYGDRCAVTGARTEAVLEAAHIAPYKGDDTNVVRNGLLLRSDIHTLFDLHLLTVVAEDETYVVRVSSEVTEDAYKSLEGAGLASVPEDAKQRPAPALLANHNELCGWLGNPATFQTDLAFVR